MDGGQRNCPICGKGLTDNCVCLPCLVIFDDAGVGRDRHNNVVYQPSYQGDAMAMDGQPFVPKASGNQIQIRSSDTDALTEMFGDEAPAVAEIMKKAEARMADEPITRKAND